jgi:hypothetical protein
MATSPAVAKATTQPATGTNFLNIFTGLANAVSTLTPTISAVGNVLNKTPGTTGAINPYSQNPQIVMVPGQGAPTNYTPYMIAGGVGLAALLTVALIARK